MVFIRIRISFDYLSYLFSPEGASVFEEVLKDLKIETVEAIRALRYCTGLYDFMESMYLFTCLIYRVFQVFVLRLQLGVLKRKI